MSGHNRKVFTVPVAGHLKTWAIKRLWENETEPYPLSEGTLVGKYAFSFLVDKRELKFIPDVRHDQEIKIRLSNTLSKRSPSVQKLVRLNKIFDHLFKHSLIEWCRAYGVFDELQMDRAKSIRMFLNYHGINNPEVYEMCYQYVTREKERDYEKAKGKN
jgi:hypothetical protein